MKYNPLKIAFCLNFQTASGQKLNKTSLLESCKIKTTSCTPSKFGILALWSIDIYRMNFQTIFLYRFRNITSQKCSFVQYICTLVEEEKR